MNNFVDLEDAVLRRILAVCLQPDHVGQTSPPTLHLGQLAEELNQDAGGTFNYKLTKDLLDRVIVSRLIESPPEQYPQAPFHYLLGCYARSSQELRSISVALPDDVRQKLQESIFAARDLIISYTGLVFMGGLVPEPQEAMARGSLQLLDSIDAKDGQGPPGAVELPGGFLEDYCSKREQEELQATIGPVVVELARRAERCSPLGEYGRPLSVIRYMASIEPLARALVAHRFLPDMVAGSGRAVHTPGQSWLGPFFGVSSIPDQLVPAQPSVRQQCFSDFQNRRQAEIGQAFASLRMAHKHLYGELHLVVKDLLKKGTRDQMVDWLAGVVEHNMERAKMQMAPERAASHGFFISLNAVLLKLCGPFMDPSNATFWKRTDVRYVTLPSRISFAGETKLATDSAGEAEWLKSQEGVQVPEWHFICECFFMTLKALHLGMMKNIHDQQDEGRRLQDGMRMQQSAEAAVQQHAGTPQEAQHNLHLQRVKAYVGALQEMRLCVEAQVGDPELLQEAIAFYRLVAAWLLQLACPSGQPELPLPEPVPMSWATLPEWFVEDVADFFLYVSRMYPHLLTGVPLEGVMMFLVVFMGSDKYVTSRYLRAKLADVLREWLPAGDNTPSWRRNPSRRDVGSAMTHLFEGHPLVLKHLTPTLLRLYTDIEFTDRAGQFHLKFNLRQNIGEVLQYLFTIPHHLQMWKQYSQEEAYQYKKFCSMLMNDATYLLDESIAKLKDLREYEELVVDQARWSALTEREQQDQESQHGTTGDHLKSYLYLAGGVVKTLHLATSQVQHTFLVDEMAERLANMLDYFLLHLTGPERRSLKVKDPEKYFFRPRELLQQIVQIYVHIAGVDSEGKLAHWIARDLRSYRPEMFSEAAGVLRGMLSEEELQVLEQLSVLAASKAAEDASLEEELGDVPDDFLDPIQCTLMRDPVILPTSNTTMDRATIARHLLSDQRDPINRQPLSEDMLKPDTELKQRINAWIRQRQAEVAAEKAKAAQQGQQQQPMEL